VRAGVSGMCISAYGYGIRHSAHHEELLNNAITQTDCCNYYYCNCVVIVIIVIMLNVGCRKNHGHDSTRRTLLIHYRGRWASYWNSTSFFLLNVIYLLS
jgi:hypothetical protein